MFCIFLKKKQQLCPYSAVWLVVYTVEKQSLSCELRTDYLKNIQFKFAFRWLNQTWDLEICSTLTVQVKT